jgi:hypothetical protein
MDQRRCRFCQKQFEPSRFHPEQTVCPAEPCQQQRRNQNRKRKLASACKWRANHAGFWKQYRAAKPGSEVMLLLA